MSLQLQGQTIPNNSLVDLADLLYHTRHSDDPTNSNGLQTLMCVTDLIDCCETPERGYWYHPDGSRVGYYSNQYGHLFESNRGQNEIINDQKFYGSVRIWRQYTPPQRGLFHCELPDANGATNILYANICELPTGSS